MEDKKKATIYLRLNDAYLCPGDEYGPHVTNSATVCGCGNTNLAPLARLLDRESTTASFLDILKEECKQLGEALPDGITRLHPA